MGHENAPIYRTEVPILPPFEVFTDFQPIVLLPLYILLELIPKISIDRSMVIGGVGGGRGGALNQVKQVDQRRMARANGRLGCP